MFVCRSVDTITKMLCSLTSNLKAAKLIEKLAKSYFLCVLVQ